MDPFAVAIVFLCMAGIAYILGSLPTAYLICGENIFKLGSGNPGTMNVYRLTGSKKLLLLTLLVDAGKAFVAIWLVSLWVSAGFIPAACYLAGLLVVSFFVVLGHNYSIFMDFRGGRGIACLIGILLAVSWPAFLACLAAVLVAILLTEIVFILTKRSARGFGKLLSISTLESQILGRVVGMALCFVPLGLIIPGTLPYLLPAIFLSFAKHAKRLLNFLKKK